MNDKATRAARIARAATEVLGEGGSAGLTHRAVDRQAGLPEGSTSNVFRTRAALIGAVCHYLTERDLGQLRAAAARLSARSEVTIDEAASELAGIIQRWTGDDALFTRARIELFLAARRNAEVAGFLAPARTAFHEFTSAWLEGIAQGGSEHNASLMAVVEGLTMNQLLHPAYKLTRARLQQEVKAVLQALTAAG